MMLVLCISPKCCGVLLRYGALGVCCVCVNLCEVCSDMMPVMKVYSSSQDILGSASFLEVRGIKIVRQCSASLLQPVGWYSCSHRRV